MIINLSHARLALRDDLPHDVIVQWRSKCGFKIGDGIEGVCHLLYKKLQLPHEVATSVLAYCYVIVHSVDTRYCAIFRPT